MQVLNIIFTVMAIAASAALSFFAGYAFVTMRKMQKEVDGMRRSVMMTLTLVMGDHVKGNFEEVNKMRETMNHLVETEQYEAAQQMQGAIEKAEHTAMESLAKFKEACGSMAEIVVTQVKVNRHDDYDDDL